MAADRRTPIVGPIGGTPYMLTVNDEVAALWNSVGIWVDSLAGTNTLTGTVIPTLDAWQKNQLYWIVPVVPNTGAVTLNIDSRGAKSIVDQFGNPLTAGALDAGSLYGVVYDGTRLWLAIGPTTDFTVPFNPLGAWSAVVTYNQGDFVNHDGVSYFSKTDGNLNNEPPDNTHWQLVAASIELASEAEATAGVNNTKAMTPLRVAQATAARTVATHADLEAVVAGQCFGSIEMLGYHVAGDGGGGRFRWDSSNLSLRVTEDTLGGRYVAPDHAPTGASGAWVRLPGTRITSGGAVVSNEGFRNAKWYGARGDNVTDDAAAINAMVESVAVKDGAYWFPTGLYRCESPVIYGYGSCFTGEKAQGAGSRGVTITFPIGHGFINDIYDGYAERTNNAQFHNLKIFGDTTGYNAGANGIWARVNPNYASTDPWPGALMIENCSVGYFQTGINLAGQADETWIDKCQIGFCGTGIRGGMVQEVFQQSFIFVVDDYSIESACNTARYAYMDVSGPGTISAACDGIWLHATRQYAISSITLSNPIRVVTSAAHNLQDGCVVLFDSVGGTVELNGNYYEVNAINSTTFDLVDIDGGTGHTPFTSGGTVQEELATDGGVACEIIGLQGTGHDIRDNVVLDGVKNCSVLGGVHRCWRNGVRIRGGSSECIVANAQFMIWGSAHAGSETPAIVIMEESHRNLIDSCGFGAGSVFGTLAIQVNAACDDTIITEQTYDPSITTEIIDNGTRTIRPAMRKTFTANGTFTISPGHFIKAIYFAETAGNAVTGGIKIGTSSGGTQVVAAQAVSGNGRGRVADADVLIKSWNAAQQLFVQAVTSWNSASVRLTIETEMFN